MTGTGRSTLSWGLDKTYLVEHFEYEMGELGTLTGMGLWTYDPKSKKYRTYIFDSDGGTAFGTITRCEETGTWYFKAKIKSPLGNRTATGKATFLDDNTVEWEWTERVFLGLFKTMEMKGTNKRK